MLIGCNVIITDDGLQHYALRRDVEICVVDGRGFGNGLLLPAGPLREPPSRLRSVDAVAVHGARDAPGLLGLKSIKWNFTKILIDKKGGIVSRFESAVTPESAEMAKAIEQALAQ